MFAIGFGVGALTGMVTAKRRKGNFLDVLQYGAGYGIALGLVLMILGILYARAFG